MPLRFLKVSAIEEHAGKERFWKGEKSQGKSCEYQKDRP